MRFPWHKYEELSLSRRNTLQIFITNACNLKCNGCFARKVIKENNSHISVKEYGDVIDEFLKKDGGQVNLLGGEPLLHPQLKILLQINKDKELKTTIYTNGYFLGKYNPEDFDAAKLRVSIYGAEDNKGAHNIPKTDIPFDANFMVSKNTNLEGLIKSAKHVEKNHNCNVFFISSIRELDNERQEFFDDTDICMPILKYKELVHDFLKKYDGEMDIHISKRGVFESTKTVADNKCRFANYFIGGKIIQCPYDVVNLKFQKDYEFDERYCQQNNSCLMSKIKLRKKESEFRSHLEHVSGVVESWPEWKKNIL